MLTIMFLSFSAGFAVFIRQLSGLAKSSYLRLLLLVLAGLCYDTLVVGIGRFAGEGDLLRALNAGRYIVHALFTPMLMIFGFGVLRSAGVTWAQGRSAHAAVCGAAALLILLGSYADIFLLDLQPRAVAGSLRYLNEGGLSGPPLPAILTIVFLIAAGISLWRKTGWIWLALGAVAMFLAAGAAMGDLFYLGNIGEVILSAGNVAAARKFLS